MSNKLKPTKADILIEECISRTQSFSVVAGAGSGKTTSLVKGLEYVRKNYGEDLRRNGQKILCITYTNRAVDVIKSRLGFDSLYQVSTLHGFLWSEIVRFQNAIREIIETQIIPNHIAKAQERDTGRATISAQRARDKMASLTEALANINDVKTFTYEESNFSDFVEGKICHDDVIDIASHLILEKPILQKGLGFKYPYIFIDEAQDTFDNVVDAFNAICGGDGLPLVGYFGDPMQQIFDNGSGIFNGPSGFTSISKEENFRSAKSIVTLANIFRNDIKQVPAGDNADIDGSVLFTLIQAETPDGPRRRYSEQQVERALAKFDNALKVWGWESNENAKKLYLVRQMIARRLGFSKLQKLFTGQFSSTKSQDKFENGEHFLLKPFLKTIFPLLSAYRNNNNRKVVEILKDTSPAFNVTGQNQNKTLGEMISIANGIVAHLDALWDTSNLKEILIYAVDSNLVTTSEHLLKELSREQRAEDYDSKIHSVDKGEWLTDKFFTLTAEEIAPYYDFINNNTALSTQHGSKGEEYDDVLVVFDDVEAGWNQYSFTKLFTPETSGDGTEGQLNKSRKLAYVCFTRAKINLRIILFTPDAQKAQEELLESGLLTEDQIAILA